MKMKELPQTKQVSPIMHLQRPTVGGGQMMLIRKEAEYSIHFSFYTTLTLYKNGYSHARRNVTHGIGKQTLFVVI